MRSQNRNTSILICLLTLILAGTAFPKPIKDKSLPEAEAIRMAIEDLSDRFPEQYADGGKYLSELKKIEAMAEGEAKITALKQLRREALLANPLLDFDKLLMIRRRVNDLDQKYDRYKWHRKLGMQLGIPNNFNGNAHLPVDGWDNEIVVMENYRDKPVLKTIYEPQRDVLISDVDLYWDAGKMLFSSVDATGHWHVYEVNIDGSDLRRISPAEFSEMDVHSYDACYLPDDRIIFVSTLTGQTVPCTGGTEVIGNLCRMNPDGTDVRRLCFDQDQNWMPTVTEQGTVLYTRWQYTDQAHRYPRIVMQMNPDGTGQREFYGSSSYWPPSLFFSRPVPGQPSRFVAIATGHHGVPRMGEMILFDVRNGRRESIDHQGMAPGVIQRITDRGETVQAPISDQYALDDWPKFLHPFPLDDQYFLVSAQTKKDSEWGVYLVDVFDNMVLLYEEEGKAIFEPLPLKAVKRPPIIADRINPESREATIYIADIYKGPGLKDVPRGTVKQLQVYTYNYPPFYKAARRNVSTTNALGIHSAWDIRGILGRVPVEPDGSARFTVPANMPIAMQPLDEDGKAMQLMRAWTTAMPGENQSCIGCHESLDMVPPMKKTKAFYREPSSIEPWHGPLRPFDFRREVQPVIDRKCVGCHQAPDTPEKPDLRSAMVDESVKPDEIIFKKGSRVLPQDFSWAYYNLQRYVWRPTGESEMPVLMPMEHHADVSELVQMLQKGHHGVKLNDEEWDRIITWIDMNAPFYGLWQDAPRTQQSGPSLEKRKEYLMRFANVEWNLHVLPQKDDKPVEFVHPQPKEPTQTEAPILEGWPMSQEQSEALRASGPAIRRTLRFGGSEELEFVWIPAGAFVMGSLDETPDEMPMAPVQVEKGFWMSTTEISNQMFRNFDPDHHSRYFNQTTESMWSKHLKPLNQNNQPVVRVSWNESLAFCEWLSKQTGETVDLPTEAEWEWAARAGSAKTFPEWTPGKQKGVANCAGLPFGKFYGDRKTLSHRLFDWDWDDGQVVTDDVTANQPNAWGLKNMHGNAAEWTKSLYKSYPYNSDDNRNDIVAEGKRVVRGGSFSDRPKRCTASYRLGYHQWQGVYNVGFRVVIRPGDSAQQVVDANE